MNEQYVTLVGKVCAPRYEEVYTPEVKSKLPIEASSEGRNLKDYTIFGNNNPNHVDESQSILPFSIDTYGGNAVDWEIFGNNNPVVETKNGNLPLELTSSAGNVIDYTIYGNNNCNKNLLEITAESQTINGITFIVDKQAGIITANGTATANARINLGTINIYNGTQYALSGNIVSPSSSAERICVLYVYQHSELGLDYGDGVIINNTGDDLLNVNIAYMVYANKTVNNAVIRPMLRPSNTTPYFEPYQIGVGEKTKNLLEITAESQTINGVTFTVDKQAGTIIANGIATNGIHINVGSVYNGLNEPFNYYLSGGADGGLEQSYFLIGMNNRTGTRLKRWNGTTDMRGSVSNTDTVELQIPANETGVIRIYIRNGVNADNLVFKPMLRKADTTSDFFPYGYQIPIQAKQRTKNLYNITNAYSLNAGVTVQEENGRLHIFGNSTNNANHIIGIMVGGSALTKISLEAGQYVLSGAVANTNSNYRIQLLYINPNDSAGAIIGYDDGNGLEFTLEEPSTVYMRIYVKGAAYQQDADLLFSPMIRRAGTSSDFEPYYNINQTDIYIGNSPLTQGQSITKAQSGQDITLFSGDNSIDTTLYNKPNVSITYNSNILGVGEPTQNEFEITGNDTYTYRGVTFVRDNINNTIVANGQATGNVFYECGDITLKAGVKYILTGCPAGGSYSPNTYLIYAMGHIDWGYDTGNGLVLPIMTEDTVITPRIGVYTGAGAFTDLVFKPEVKKVGYQIPISVTSRQQSVLHNIYVGENPLTAEQSISKTSTGTDIVLYQGENTISTTLGNKPDMKIDYLSTEVGVGERTKNFIRATVGVTTSGITYTVDSVAGIVTANGTATGSAQLRIAINYPEQLNNNTVPPGNYYFSGCPSDGSGDSYNCYSWDYDAGARSKQWDGTTAVETDRGQGNCQVQISGRPQSIILRITQGYTANNVVFKPMLRRADTTPDFEPYGYQIPIDIKQDNEVVDHKDIYIGTQPLEEGASVSKVSVGEDIALASGNNYIDTDLFNKPEMYIK